MIWLDTCQAVNIVVRVLEDFIGISYSMVLPKGTCNGCPDYGVTDHVSCAERVPFAPVCCRCCVAVSTFCRPVSACCKGATPFDRISDASGLLEFARLPGSRRYAYSLTMFTARSTQQAPKSGKPSSQAHKCACYMGACKGVVSMRRARAALCADESVRGEAKPETRRCSRASLSHVASILCVCK